MGLPARRNLFRDRLRFAVTRRLHPGESNAGSKSHRATEATAEKTFARRCVYDARVQSKNAILEREGRDR